MASGEPAIALTASLGTAFRAPDATDRFGFGGDPDLDPETGRSVRARGYATRSTHQNLALTPFRTKIDDLILFTVTEAFRWGAWRTSDAPASGTRRPSTKGTGDLGRRLSALIQEPRNLIPMICFPGVPGAASRPRSPTRLSAT
jgi:vitamin B12 transporter